jgi:Do/DeqQ family serine protease
MKKTIQYYYKIYGRKHMLKRAIITLFISCFTFTAQAHSIATSPGKFAEEIKKDSNSVVSIFVEKVNHEPFAIPHENEKSKQEEAGLGSGVIINAKEGLIITNAHVVNKGKVIIVHLKDGRRFLGHIIGQDTGFDIAVVKINADNLTSIHFADSDSLKVGDSVVAIGSPFGLDQTVTSGIVSALNVSHPQIEGFQSFIQTDAPINPGNSGGPLINKSGMIVGINTAILGPGGNIGIGFSIPSNMVKSVYQQLIEHHHVERGALGVIGQKLTWPLKKALNIPQNTSGTLVSEVVNNSPAKHAGILAQDIIEKVNNKNIQSSEQLRNMLGLMQPGSKISLTILRGDKHMALQAIVGSPQKLLTQKTLPFIGGEHFQNFKEMNGDGSITQGVITTQTSITSNASLAGLMKGDVIIEAAGKSVNNNSQLLKIVRSMNKEKELLVHIKRGPIKMFLVIQNT